MRTIITLFFSLFIVSLIDAQTPVKWYSIEEAVELNKKEPRKFMIDVYTSWCGWCKVMDSKTFSNPVIAQYLNEKYYPVKLNAEQKEDITIGDKTYKYIEQGTRGYHELASALLSGKLSYPSVVFLNEQIQIIHLEQGYIQAKPFDMIIKYIGGNFYLNQPWATWSASYTSTIPSE